MVSIAKFSPAIIAAIIIAACSASNIQKSPAKVLISQDRSNEETLNVDIQSNGEVHQLRMAPAESIWAEDAKIVELKNKHGTDYLEEVDVSKDFKIYKDANAGAVLDVQDGRVSGIVNNNLAVKYEDGQQHLYQTKNNKTRNGGDDYLEIPDEVLNMRESPVDYNFYRNDYLEIPEDENVAGRVADNGIARQTRRYRVEVAVVVGSAFSTEFSSNQQLIRYITIFYNAVNERFATIANPKIEIKLVAVVIIRSTSGEPFISSNRLSGNQINGVQTLRSFSRWVRSRRSTLPRADVFYLQTARNMVDVSNPTAGVNLAGIAWRGAACVASSTVDYSTGMGEDIDCYFNGVHTATHEIAHILGAPHDGQANLNTGSCSWTGGYIMSYTAGTINRLFFSSCSIERMSTYMRTSRASCLSTSATVPQSPLIPNTNSLPGNVITMDTQCKRLTGINNATVFRGLSNQNILCYNMICQVRFANGGMRITGHGAVAAENARCPFGGRCNDGACV